MRLRVSELDQFRYYANSEMTAQELQQRLRGEVPASRKMDAGTAWHAVLENPPAEVDVIESQGFTFRVECDATLRLPQVREIRAERTYCIDGEPVTLSGGCDGITALLVGDHKLTERPDVERYAQAYQWRAYLELFNATAFDYWLWHAAEKDGVFVIRDMHAVRFWRYPEMHDDLMAGLRDFVEFARFFLPERFDDALPGIDDLEGAA